MALLPRRALWITLLVVAIGLGLLALRLMAPGSAPGGKQALTHLGPTSIAALTERFDAAADSTRLLVLLSPTCVMCVRGASALQGVFYEIGDRRVRAFVVWEPVLPSDKGPPGATALAQLEDPRVEQFWDPERILSGRILSAARRGVPELALFSGDQEAAWDLVAIYPPGVRWKDEVPTPVYVGNPVVAALDSVRARLASGP